MKDQKLDTFKQLETYKHMKMHGNNTLNKQNQFRSHILFDYITQQLSIKQ